MALQEGETYRCTTAECGCEVQVTRGPQGDGGGDSNPTCCCGAEMKKI